MKVGSLCTGYGGLEMAVESVFESTDLRFVSDIDKHANTLLTHHHPNVPNLGDLTKVDWRDVEQVDLLCAGYPCQPFSLAGNRKGEDDERAIFEYIADGISILRPRWLLLENVPGHLTLGGTSVIATLTKLGYDNIQWGIVRASDTGAPHKRARLFIWAQTSNTSSKGLQRRSSRRSARLAEDVSGQDRQVASSNSNFVADTNDCRLESVWSEHRLEKTSRETFCFSFFGPYEYVVRQWAEIVGRKPPVPVDDRGVEPKFVEWMMGLPEGHVTGLNLNRTAQLKMLGNGVVPQQGALAIELLTALL